MDPLDLASIGIEDRLVGSITFMRLSRYGCVSVCLYVHWSIHLSICSKPGESSVQVLLLAVRHRWRGLGVGGYLLRLSKDPAIVGQYDVVLTFADHKAEKFFSRHGFTDDPIITARYKYIDIWSVTPAIFLSISPSECMQTIGRTVHLWSMYHLTLVSPYNIE